MPYPVWLAGMTITAQRLTDMQWHTVSQGSDQTVNNSTALVNSSLSIPVVANATYRFRLLANHQGSATPDIKFNWSLPAGASINRWCLGPGPGASGGSTDFTTTAWRRLTDATDNAASGAGTSVNVAYLEFGEITVGGTAGNAIVQFAQNSAQASDTILTGQSLVDYLRIG